MPAIDILQLAENEGSNYKQDLKICFAGQSFYVFQQDQTSSMMRTFNFS